MAMKKPKLGSGERFKAVEKSAAKSGATDPAAVAAAVGIKKYGKQKMAKMAEMGKERKAKMTESKAKDKPKAKDKDKAKTKKR